jgi:chemotaxis response regulator CheB
MKYMVVVGASSGGIEALRELIRGLPEHFAAAVYVVLHPHRTRRAFSTPF